jgi:Mn2+/Fe2+ NRAMP family transporter
MTLPGSSLPHRQTLQPSAERSEVSLEQKNVPRFWSRLRSLRSIGPGIVTGASDDDPSGIATHSQAGAQFGFTFLWMALFSYPLMCAVREISARIRRVTGNFRESSQELVLVQL